MKLGEISPDFNLKLSASPKLHDVSSLEQELLHQLVELRLVFEVQIVFAVWESVQPATTD